MFKKLSAVPLMAVATSGLWMMSTPAHAADATATGKVVCVTNDPSSPAEENVRIFFNDAGQSPVDENSVATVKLRDGETITAKVVMVKDDATGTASPVIPVVDKISNFQQDVVGDVKVVNTDGTTTVVSLPNDSQGCHEVGLLGDNTLTAATAWRATLSNSNSTGINNWIIYTTNMDLANAGTMQVRAHLKDGTTIVGTPAKWNANGDIGGIIRSRLELPIALGKDVVSADLVTQAGVVVPIQLDTVALSQMSYVTPEQLGLKQTVVEGNNNDTLMYRGVNVPLTWTDGTATVTKFSSCATSVVPGTDTTGTSDYPDGCPIVILPDGTHGQNFNVALTDSGIAPTTTTTTTSTVMVEETYQEKVPVVTSKTSCDDPIVGTFQVDKYLSSFKPNTWVNGHLQKKAVPLTDAQRKLVATLDDDNKLTYREDRTLWGSTDVKFVTLHLSDVTKNGSVAKAIQAKTGELPIANVISFNKGQSVVKAWKLPTGASVAMPWGSNKNGVQSDMDTVALPKAVCTTTNITTWVTRTATRMVPKTVTSTKTVTNEATPVVSIVKSGNIGG